MRNAETVLNIIREDSRTVCNWRAVCDESRKSGCVSSEGWHVQQETVLPG